MQSELKACPFCGGEAIKCGSNEMNPRHWIMCRECHACPGGDVAEISDAESRWNRRAALSDQERAVEVKALEWRLQTEGVYAAATPLVAVYSIWRHKQGEWKCSLLEGAFPTSDHAKFAAQADYEQRTRSALVDVPVEPVAKQWCAFEGGHQHTSWYPDGYGDRAGWEALAKRNPAKYQVVTRDLFASPPIPHREGEDSAEVKRRFHVEWMAGARPPMHPEAMVGRTTFETFDKAITHMCNQAEDAAFISLEERITTTVSVDRSADARAALAATRSASATSAEGDNHG